MGSFISWFERSYKGIIVVLVAIMAITMVVLATQHVDKRRPDAGAKPGPIPTFSSSPDTRPVAVFIGDSYTAGAGSSGDGNTFPAIVGREQQWRVINLGRGGTGYTADVTEGTQNACARDECPNYSGMLADAAAAQPSIVVVSGGRNDIQTPSGTEHDKVNTFFIDLRTALPNARIIVTSPVWDDDDAPPQLAVIRSTVKAAAETVNADYLDIGEPLAGEPALISADGVHPNDAGYRRLASVISAAI